MNSQISLLRRPALAALLIIVSASAVLAQTNDVTGSISGHGIGQVQGGTLQAAAATSPNSGS